MKLTHLSLSVLVALGLVACGGSSSDNKDDAAKDPTAGQVPEQKPEQKPTEPKDGEHVVKDPTNEAGGVEGRFKNDVKARTTTYATRKGLDTLAGYNSEMEYQDGSTSTDDILRASSMVKYLDANWINDNSDGEKANVLRLNSLQTYVKSKSAVDGDEKHWKGKYVRIKTVQDSKGNKIRWDHATVDSQFVGVDGEIYKATDLYYLPNPKVAEKAKIGNKSEESAEPEKSYVYDKGIVPGLNALDITDPKSFMVNRGDVKLKFIRVGADKDGKGGTDYRVDDNDSNNIFELNLGNIPYKTLTTKNIDLGYSIVDNKATATLTDDDNLARLTSAGELRIYDVNYSRALLEVNQAAREDSGSANAAVRNGLGFDGDVKEGYIKDYGSLSGIGRDGSYGPFQVQGSRTGSIPVNGRGQYTGKSFGVNSVGDIELEADFAENRATIHGLVVNRKTYGKNPSDLQPFDLGIIQLSGNNVHFDASKGLDSTSLATNGLVKYKGQNWGTWAVGFYGPNATSAAGVIAAGADQVNDSTLQNVVEVFSAERGDLLPHSLNN